MKNIAFVNLGCSKNVVDGETIAAFLQAHGFLVEENVENASVIAVNTCTFIQEATTEAIDTILAMAQLKKTAKCKELIVCGCFAERYRDQVQKEFPEVDCWIGVRNWKMELRHYFNICDTDIIAQRTIDPSSKTQYLKISDGCSHRCSFCIIPSIRGPFQSRSIDSIVNEALWLQQQGVNECVVVSQDTSFYGRDMQHSLQELLEILLKKTTFHWIRMMYLHPQYVDDSLLKLVASEKRLCSYFDIPLQHIADPVLENMNRRPLSAGIYELIEKIRALVPDTAIRTSFILGFPGETEKHFRELLTFVEWARFEKVGVFPFSAEQGTHAYSLPHRPRTATAQRRCEIIMELQRKISREIAASSIGSVKEVIIDRVSDNPDFNFEGRTQADAPEVDATVWIEEGDCTPGEFCQVRIVDADEYDLYAVKVS